MLYNLSPRKIVISLFLLLYFTTIDAQAQNAKRDKIPGQFIVTLNDNEDPRSVAKDHGLQPKFVFRHAMNGFVASASELAHQKLKGDPRVRMIEQDAITTTDGLDWGQDRIDQRKLPLDNTYKKNYTGQGVTAYVLDGGIRYDHQE